MSEFVTPGDLCYDIGAHAGDITALLLEAGARVVAVEPQPDLVAQLAQRFDGSPEVTVVATGVGARPGTAMLSVCDQATVVSTLKEHWKTGRFRDRSWDRQVEVTMHTLDQLIERFGLPAFSKVDVEGSEIDVLRGLSRPLPALSFEYACEFLDDAERCVERLIALGDYRFNYSSGEEYRFASGSWLSGRELTANLAGNSDPLAWGDIWAVTTGPAPNA